MISCSAKRPYYLVAVDPGKRKVGVSIWRCTTTRDRLVAATCILGAPRSIHLDVVAWAKSSGADGPSVVWCIEKMQDYHHGKANASGLDALRAMSAALVSRLPDGVVVMWLTPREWKGNVPKDIHHARVKKLLGPTELKVAGRYQHDKWDAIALGMTAAGRCARGGKKHKRK